MSKGKFFWKLRGEEDVKDDDKDTKQKKGKKVATDNSSSMTNVNAATDESIISKS